MKTRLAIELELAYSEIEKLRSENYRLEEMVKAQEQKIISLREQLEMAEDRE